jgi:hypothetical protein
MRAVFIKANKNMETKENVENMKKCSMFSECSCNVCPLDSFARERMALPEDKKCYFISKDKGNRRTITDKMLKLVPKSNYKLLNQRSQNKIARQTLA